MNWNRQPLLFPIVYFIHIHAYVCMYGKCHSSRNQLTNCQLIWEMLCSLVAIGRQTATAADTTAYSLQSAFGPCVNMCGFMCRQPYRLLPPYPLPFPTSTTPCHTKSLCICISNCGNGSMLSSCLPAVILLSVVFAVSRCLKFSSHAFTDCDTYVNLNFTI